MTVSSIRKCMLLSIIGFLLLAIDIYIPTGISYPKPYDNDSTIIGEYQYYNVKTFFGATCTYKTLDASGNVIQSGIPVGTGQAEFVDQVFFVDFRLDVFNDVLGFVFIAISCLILGKYNPLFKMSCLLSFVGITLKIALAFLPFIINGMFLCNMSLGMGIAYTTATIITTYFLTKGYIKLIPGACCRDERLWISTGWFISFVLMVLVLFLTWLDLNALSALFNLALIVTILLIGVFLKRTDEFAARSCQQ